MNKDFDIYKLEDMFKLKEIDIFDESPLNQIKQIIQSHLTATQRRILLIYLYAGSGRKAEALTDIKYRQVLNIVKESIQIIKQELRRIEIKNLKIIK